MQGGRMKQGRSLVLESRAVFVFAAVVFVLVVIAIIRTAHGLGDSKLTMDALMLGLIVPAPLVSSVRIDWHDDRFEKGYLFGAWRNTIYRSEDLVSIAVRRDYTQRISRMTLYFRNGSVRMHHFQTGFEAALLRVQNEFPGKFGTAAIEMV
jgi:hypothetical protein